MATSRLAASGAIKGAFEDLMTTTEGLAAHAAGHAEMGNIPVVGGSCGLPMILPSSGSIGNNGALSGITALPAAYTSCYMYFPAGAIYSGSVAGMYYVVMSSTTAGTIYADTYSSGVPAIPETPTPIVATGPGAYTQTTGTNLTLYQQTIAGGVMGVNGALFVYPMFAHPNNANQKIESVWHGDNVVAGWFNTTTVNEMRPVMIRNQGAANKQVTSATVGLTSSITAPTYFATNTAIDNVVKCTGRLIVATDYIVLLGATIQVFP